MQAAKKQQKTHAERDGEETRRPIYFAGLIVLGIALAWANSLHSPFLLDDHSSILSNASIRSSSPLRWLQPPATAGETVSGRPLLNASFAINHALFGLDVRAYRVTNLLIHAAAAVAFAGVVRRTLSRLWKSPRNSYGPAAAAGICALIWSVHPLSTAAVTYIVQRAESLAGLFCVLTLYGFVRSLDSPAGAKRWQIMSIGASLCGMATKETAVVAPLLVLLYDRAFVTGTFRTALMLRTRFYLALAATWLMLVTLILLNPGRGGSAGTASAVNVWAYFLTQCSAILHYLRLVVWPTGQVFDYGTPVVESLGAVLPHMLFLAVAALATCWGLIRNHAAGFLGACFFVLLAPSSSVIPVSTQTIAEHRMYLALMPVVFAGVLLTRRYLRSTPVRLATAAAIVIGLGAATHARNAIYSSELSLWQDTVRKAPKNPRAHNNLGLALVKTGRLQEATEAYLKAIELQPNHAYAHSNLANVFVTQGRWVDASRHYAAAVTADPTDLDARVNLGHALAGAGKREEAKAQFQAVLDADPSAHDARTNLASILITQGDVPAAIRHLKTVLRAEPHLAEAHLQLGLAREKSGDSAGARASFRNAIAAKPDLAPAHVALGNLALGEGDISTARTAYQTTLRLDPGSADAHYGMGILLAQAGQFGEAKTAFEKTLQREPAHTQARTNLGNCQLALGEVPAAIATYTQALKQSPDDQATRQNLELAKEILRSREQ